MKGRSGKHLCLQVSINLDNLVCICDRNRVQLDGYTEEIMPLEPLRLKIEAFGWEVLEIDGHNIEA